MKLFRENVLKKLSTPEDLTTYIKVSTPSSWLIAIGGFIFVVGVCVWLFFGVINTRIQTTVVAKNGIIQSIVDKDEMQRVQKKMKVKINNDYLEVASVGSYDSDINGYRLYIDGDLPDGVYPAEIILEAVRPIEFFAK